LSKRRVESDARRAESASEKGPRGLIVVSSGTTQAYAPGRLGLRLPQALDALAAEKRLGLGIERIHAAPFDLEYLEIELKRS
jgi:hypothetical protein